MLSSQSGGHSVTSQQYMLVCASRLLLTMLHSLRIVARERITVVKTDRDAVCESLIWGLNSGSGGVPGWELSAVNGELGAGRQAAGHAHLRGAALDDVTRRLRQPVQRLGVDPGQLAVKGSSTVLHPLHHQRLHVSSQCWSPEGSAREYQNKCASRDCLERLHTAPRQRLPLHWGGCRRPGTGPQTSGTSA